MSKWQLDFEISKEIESDEIVSLLNKSFRVKESPRETVNRGFYDSFDWRIYAKGMVLEIEAVGRQLRLIYRPIDLPFPCNRTEIHSVPRFAGDIPNAPFCGALTSLLGPRVLLRQVEVESYSSKSKFS